ncbi:MAG: cupin domain-containing protein [Myxococcota bacterium]
MTKPVHIDGIDAYEGPHAIPGIRFRAARQALGVTSWGMNVLDLDPHTEGHPEHDHAGDGQEEVYFVIEGAAVLRLGERELVLKRGDFVRVAPEETRKLVTRDSGARILALGATPGRAFEPKM